MTSDQPDTVPETDAAADKVSESRHDELRNDGPQHDGSQPNGRFNALDVLARLPDLSRDQPVSYSRSSRRHRTRPREVSLRLLGGSVIGLFVLAIAVPFFWSGSGEDASLPDEAAASFKVDSAATTKKTESATPTVTPIASIEASPQPSVTPTGPLDASEFEKALGVVETEPTQEEATVAAIQPFVVGDQSAVEPSAAMNGGPAPTRPLAPRFEEAPGNLAHTHGAAAQAPAESTHFTPWQPNMAATQYPAYPGRPQNEPHPGAAPGYSPPSYSPQSYSPWSAGTGPAPSAPGPAPREPAYTAMNPNPSGTTPASGGRAYQNPPPSHALANPNPSYAPAPASGGRAYENPPLSHRPTNPNPPYAPAVGGTAYENPSPVWSPGNPYAAPNSAQNTAPRDVSGIQNPYQQ